MREHEWMSFPTNRDIIPYLHSRISPQNEILRNEVTQSTKALATSAVTIKCIVHFTLLSKSCQVRKK